MNNSKRKMIKSGILMAVVLILIIAATVAWFAINNSANVEPISLVLSREAVVGEIGLEGPFDPLAPGDISLGRVEVTVNDPNALVNLKIAGFELFFEDETAWEAMTEEEQEDVMSCFVFNYEIYDEDEALLESGTEKCAETNPDDIILLDGFKISELPGMDVTGAVATIKFSVGIKGEDKWDGAADVHNKFIQNAIIEIGAITVWAS